MPIVAQNGEIHVVRLSVSLNEFPGLLSRHRNAYPNTLDVESVASKFIRSKFHPAHVADFVRSVCQWGGYSGIGARALKKNSPRAMADAFRVAYRQCRNGHEADAVEKIQGLEQLGFSFASKHLRFLAPRCAVVLDGVISSRLGYDMTGKGYSEWLGDCAALTSTINNAKISNPLRPRKSWLVCDIEMAIFAKLRNL